MIQKISFGLKSSVCLFLSLLLISCSSPLEIATKIGQVIWDPSIPVGKSKDRPSTMVLALLADEDINPNDNSEPSPLQLQVVYLSEDSKLLASYYEQFETEKLSDVLGKNYIDHQDYAIQPSQYKVISDLILDKENQYLGVIAYYSEPEKSQWRKVIPLKGKGHNYNILIHLKKWSFDVKEYEE